VGRASCSPRGRWGLRWTCPHRLRAGGCRPVAAIGPRTHLSQGAYHTHRAMIALDGVCIVTYVFSQCRHRAHGIISVLAGQGRHGKEKRETHPLASARLSGTGVTGRRQYLAMHRLATCLQHFTPTGSWCLMCVLGF